MYYQKISENDNFNQLLAIKTVTCEKWSKIKALNKNILNILLKPDETKKLKLRKKTANEFNI